MATRLPQLTADQLDESGHLLGRITGQNLIIDGVSHDGILASAIWLLRADEPAAEAQK
jgi:hypothetical protein